jgi:hypothetical protein
MKENSRFMMTALCTRSLHHQFPCLATMAMDREFQDTLMHRAGNMLKQTAQQSIKDAGLDRYSV